jgi:hypothetical protein
MSEKQLAKIGLPTWREDAIHSVVSMYDDDGETGEALVKVKRNATDSERYNELVELLSEIYPEAAALVRSSKASPKTKVSICIGRLTEVSREGREFAAITATTYDFRDVEAPEKQAPSNGGRRTKRPGPASDEAIREVVKRETAKDKPAPKPTTRKPAAKTQAKRTPATTKPKTTTRTRTK